ncbi:hypothetical protein [Deinococcus navajonensis]|uniref:Uncharacterized protein n=1 Tax=Deinococcus navajonensis TaxID=309884 RepID=A0ABV8XIF0_9DEIO
MIAVLILIVIFSGIALITYVDNTTKAGRRAALRGGAPAEALPGSVKVLQEPSALPAPAQETQAPGAGPDLLLPLPEPARTRAWGLLCLMADAQAGQASGGAGDVRTRYLLAQTRDVYLPDTLRAYLGLTEGARKTLAAQGQPPEQLLLEQLALIEDGVREALRHDHAAADRLLTQGRFLRERFGPLALDLRTDPQP